MFLIKSPPFDACISFDVIDYIYTHACPPPFVKKNEEERGNGECGNKEGGLRRRVEMRRGGVAQNA